MRDLFVVAKFTIKDMIQRKSFIISNIIILCLIVIGFNIPNILKMIKGDESESSGENFLIVDSENVFEGTLGSLNEMNLGYKFNISNDKLTFEDIKKKISNDKVPENIVNALTSIYSNLQISKLGLTQEQLESINPKFNFEMKQTEEQEVHGNQFAMMMISIVLFYAIYFCAYQVSSAITTEKTSKIIETLVTSTTPKTIVLGKTIGIGIVGLLQIIVIIATAMISKILFLEEGMLDGLIDFSTFTPFLAIITILYFIFGYAVYALLYALVGSTVSKPEDVQSANSPIAIISVIGFYLAYFTMMNPTSELNKIAAIVPISSPFCMPLRVMMGIASQNEIAISLIILVITILIIAKISIKIYSQAILNYGSKISLKDALKLYKNKNV